MRNGMIKGVVFALAAIGWLTWLATPAHAEEQRIFGPFTEEEQLRLECGAIGFTWAHFVPSNEQSFQAEGRFFLTGVDLTRRVNTDFLEYVMRELIYGVENKTIPVEEARTGLHTCRELLTAVN